MATIEFDALDYHADQTFRAARYRFDGDVDGGWKVARDDAPALSLGPGYRLLRTQECGVCSTDLARHFLPFPLPQVTGHEVVARDDSGRRYVVEINASHQARHVRDGCAFCNAGLATHCPERLVLGIHDLPGGFGPWILAPVGACLEVPDSVPDATAVLVEPFAAALNAVTTIAPRNGDAIAVLGARRLGMLVVAALASVRARMRKDGADFTIAALVRDPALLPLARALGAAETPPVASGGTGFADGSFDVVVDTTGNPDGLATATRLARREVHLKSTHGRPSCGLAQTTALVVDELAIERFPDAAPPPGTSAWERLRTGVRPRIAWLAAADPPAWLAASADVARGGAAALAGRYAAEPTIGLPRADVAVAGSAADVDAAIRPRPGHEASLIRPRGVVLVHPSADTSASALIAVVVARGLRLSSSRCGDFRSALELLAADPELQLLGDRLITHRFRAAELPRAFEVARSRACIKAVVEQR